MKATSPDIILIGTDQQRHDTIAALGAHWMQTPHLDRLVAQGRAYPLATTPSPVCMAARTSMLTGQYSTTHRTYSNHHAGPRPEHHLFSVLREQGYRTALIGKNHTFLEAGDVDLFEWSPRGHDQAAQAERIAWEREVRRRHYPRLALEPAAGGPSGSADYARTDAALDYLQQAAADEVPTFLWLSLHAPHTPYVVPEPYFSQHESVELPPVAREPDGLARKPLRQLLHLRNEELIGASPPQHVDRMRRVYAGMVSLVDDQVGRVLDYLESSGRADRTLVIFCSDHGDYQGDHGLMTKSPAMYDCLMRVPMIARHPGRLDPGIDERFASLVDLLPTVCEAIGAAAPAGCQGESLYQPSGRSAAFSEYGIPGTPCGEEALDALPSCNPNNDAIPWEGNPYALPGRIRAIRTERWKYVQEEGGTDELYDLEADPHELVNLASDPRHAATLDELRRRLDEWKRQLPGVELDYIPAPMEESA